MGLSGQSGAPRAGLAGAPLGPSLPFPPLSHLTQRPPSHLPGHRAMLQNLVCFSGPSQGLPPNWGGLQVRVRSRKPRPQVLEHRLQGDHSSQAPCTTEGTKHSATPVCPSPQPGHPPLMPRPLTRTPRPLLLLSPAPHDAPPTWTHSGVVAQPLLPQGPAALRAVGGRHTEARASLPALTAGAGAHAPRGPLLGRGVTCGPRPTASQACCCPCTRATVRPSGGRSKALEHPTRFSFSTVPFSSHHLP